MYDNTGGKRAGKNTIKIMTSTVVSIAIVAALLGFWFYSSSGRRKRQEGDFVNLLSIKEVHCP